DTGRRQLQQRLREGVEGAEERDALSEAGQILKKGIGWIVREDRSREPIDRCIIALVRVDPAGMDLRLLRRLLHVGGDPVAELGVNLGRCLPQWPGAQK